jgi:hypothetical protein
MSILCAIIQLYLALIRKKNFVIDALFAESISMLLKGILQLLTILPDSDPNNPYCNENMRHPTYYSINFDSCGNMIWSGHTTHLIFALYWIKCVIGYNSCVVICYNIMATLIILFELLMLISLQIHYSVDVFLAVIFSFLFLTHSYRENMIEWYEDVFRDNTPKIQFEGIELENDTRNDIDINDANNIDINNIDSNNDVNDGVNDIKNNNYNHNSDINNANDINSGANDIKIGVNTEIQ